MRWRPWHLLLLVKLLLLQQQHLGWRQGLLLQQQLLLAWRGRWGHPGALTWVRPCC
jgi:hypothetical protein